jgi:hypothetical protein
MAVLESGCGGSKEEYPSASCFPLNGTYADVFAHSLHVVNGSYRITTIGPDERSSYPLEGQVYYVPDQPASGRTTLNRLINSGGTDHADAISNLSGYSQDMVLGFFWTKRLTFRRIATCQSS